MKVPVVTVCSLDLAVLRESLHGVDAPQLLGAGRHVAGETRGGPRAVAPTGAPPQEGVWTLDLHSWRPLHPARLLANVERLAAGPLRSRGHFWVPTRPDVVCAWDGAGGRVSIGDVGSWITPPQTHLMITGTERDPAEVLTAFDVSLVTDAELAEGLTGWCARDDGLDPWLGERRTAA